MLSNSAQIISVMTSFFCMSFQEITLLGFDLNSLDTVKAVLSDHHISSLRQQVEQLQLIEDKISQELPSVKILEEFLDLMSYLKNSKDQTSQNGNGGTTTSSVASGFNSGNYLRSQLLKRTNTQKSLSSRRSSQSVNMHQEKKTPMKTALGANAVS